MSTSSSQDFTTQPLLSPERNHIRGNSNSSDYRRRPYGATTSEGSSHIENVDETSIPQSTIEPAENRSTLRYMQRFGFGLGHIYNDFCAGIWFSYTLLFLKSVLLLPAQKAGALVMLGQVSDAVATPVVGILADRYGTKRQWHAYGTIMVFSTFPLIFSICPFCNTSQEWWSFTYFSICITLFQFGWACVQITHFAMIPELSISEKDRSDLTATRYSATVFANVIVYITTWAVLQNRKIGSSNNIGPSDAYRFRDISLILTFIGVTMTVLFQFSLAISGYEKRRALTLQTQKDVTAKKNANVFGSNIEQDNTTTEPTIVTARALPDESSYYRDKNILEPNSFSHNYSCTSTATPDHLSTIKIERNSGFKNFLRSKLLYQNAMLYVFARLFMTTTLIYLPLWLDQRSYVPNTKVVPEPQTTELSVSKDNSTNFSTTIDFLLPKTSIEHLATVPLVSFLASFVAAMILKNLNSYISHRVAYFIGSLVCLSGCIWIILGATITTAASKLYMVAFLLGSGSSITMISSLCITADMIGSHTYQGGFIYSAVTFADKLITGIIILIIETLKCETRSNCPEYYRNILGYGCALACTMGLTVLVSLKCDITRNWRTSRTSRRIST